MATEKFSGNILLRPYSDKDWELLLPFIRSQWGKGHPMADRRLFDWQFRGFGQGTEAVRPILLFLEGQLAGFRGVIPGLYQVPSARGMQVLPGGSLAMWMLREGCRGKGLGRMMHKAAEERLPIITGAGSNPSTSVPIYLQNGFQLLESMHRYLAVLDPEECAGRFGKRVSEIPPRLCGKAGDPVAPVASRADELAEIWEGSAFEAGFFSLYRNAEFWRWRILESPGFRYVTFVDPDGSGFLAAREERLPEPAGKPGDGHRSVLRLIDLVPARPSTWRGSEDLPFARFLGRCLDWAFERGGIAADFHCSSGIFRPILEKAGFAREQDLLRGGVPPLPRLFNGSEGTGRPINALARVPFPVSFEKSYMVKSDNDMDRPRRLDENGEVLY